jgi:hypothetical protein
VQQVCIGIYVPDNDVSFGANTVSYLSQCWLAGQPYTYYMYSDAKTQRLLPNGSKAEGRLMGLQLPNPKQKDGNF